MELNDFMESLLNLAPWIILIYALLVAVGGVVGYIQAKSKVSLILGLASGLVLFAAWWLYRETPTIGIGIGSVMAIALLGVFVMRYIKTKSFMPAGLMSILSGVVGLALTSCWLNLPSS
ncbi:TMEM14 family protein [Merismopedia glauca]